MKVPAPNRTAVARPGRFVTSASCRFLIALGPNRAQVTSDAHDGSIWVIGKSRALSLRSGSGRFAPTGFAVTPRFREYFPL